MSFALNECGKLGLEDKTRKVPKEVLQTVEEGKQKLADLIAERRRRSRAAPARRRIGVKAAKQARVSGIVVSDFLASPGYGGIFLAHMILHRIKICGCPSNRNSLPFTSPRYDTRLYHADVG